MAFDSQRPPLDWKSALWLPVWLIGLGIISWQGQYDGGAKLAPVNTNNIPFWWDIVVVAAFSLAIYYWAMYSKLPREKMLALVSVQQAEPRAGVQLRVARQLPGYGDPRSGRRPRSSPRGAGPLAFTAVETERGTPESFGGG